MEEKQLEPNLVTQNLDEIFKKMEKEKRFNEDVNPVNWDEAKPVTPRYPFRPGLLRGAVYGLTNIFIKKFSKNQAEEVYKVKVEGLENLKGIESAVVIANHFMIFDCLIYKHILKRKTKILGSEFNNRKGKLGFLMRAGGMLPLNLGQMPLEVNGLTAHESRRRSYEVTKKLKQAISYYLKHKQFLLVYPEQSMWYMYRKPRPFQSGAFYFAVQNKVPIVPMFTTMNSADGKDTQLTVHIGAPIYPKEELNSYQNREVLKTAGFAYFKEVYERVYDKKLAYESE